MDCREAQDRLSEYQDGNLTGGAAETLSEHLRGCSACVAVAHSLTAVRESLRHLPATPAPPELLARIRAAIDGETAGPVSSSGAADAAQSTFHRRFRFPLEVAAALLLFASVYWYQKAPPAAPPPAVPVASAPVPAASKPSSGAQKTGSAGRVAAVAQPKARSWSPSDLPTAPALRASTNAERIVPDSFGTLSPLSHRAPSDGGEVLLKVGAENREGAEERVAAAARRLGGVILFAVRSGSAESGGDRGAVRVVLPEPAGPLFLMELGRLGRVPAEGKPETVDLYDGPRPRAVSYTVHIRTR